MSRHSPPWSGNYGNPGLTTWHEDWSCKKCGENSVQAAHSQYSGCSYLFCTSCGDDYPDCEVDSYEEEEKRMEAEKQQEEDDAYWDEYFKKLELEKNE